MTTISLRDYNQYISSLIEQDNNAEAMFHCTSILKSYPKCIEAYQNLGRALLESKRYSEAAEIFLQVLAVFPDDFVAHVGLSSVYEENRDLDKAIWHMEQAFETQTSNLTIQEELRRLFGRRDGIHPVKIRLTRGALIRMYAKGELYQQAIAESQSALQTDKDRVDLQVLLARVYYLSGAYSESAKACSEIFEKYPYCYEANQIMFELLTKSEDSTYDPIYQHRLTELDPYFGFIDASTSSVTDVPSDKIMLEKSEYIPSEKDVSLTPEWAKQIGITWNETLEYQADSGKNPAVEQVDELLSEEDILSDSPSPAVPFIDETQEQIDEIVEEQGESSSGNIPDWIAKAGWILADDQSLASSSTEEANEITNEVLPEDGDQAALAEDLPDWLSSFNPEKTVPAESFVPADEESPTASSESNISDIPILSSEDIEEIISGDVSSELDLIPEDIPEESVTTPAEADIHKDFYESVEVTSKAENIPDLPDWLTDLGIGDIDTPSIDENSTAWMPSMEEENNKSAEAFDFIADLAESDLVGQAESEEESFPSISSSTDDVPLEELLPEEPISQDKTELPQSDTEKIRENPAVPSWVQKILGTSAVTSPAPIQGDTAPAAPKVMDIEQPDEAEDLITDLPGEQQREGAISEDMNEELMAWLKDINPDDTLETVHSPSEPQINKEQLEPESSEISFEKLSESMPMDDEHLEITSEINEELGIVSEVGVTSLDDRLSDLLESETEISGAVKGFTGSSIAPEVVTEIPLEPSEEPIEGDVLIGLLKKGDYSAFTKAVNERSFQDDIADQIIEELHSEISIKPDSLELWQGLGDINLKKSNFDDALNAYREAERILFR